MSLQLCLHQRYMIIVITRIILISHCVLGVHAFLTQQHTSSSFTTLTSSNTNYSFHNNNHYYLLSNDKYLENDLVSIYLPIEYTSIIMGDDNNNNNNNDSSEKCTSPILCVVRPDGGINPLCIHEDDNENDLFIHPKLAYTSWWINQQDNINDNDIVSTYGEGWYGQRVVPSLGGGPGYGASADDVWTVDEEVLEKVKGDGVIIPVLDLGMAHGEKARGGAI